MARIFKILKVVAAVIVSAFLSSAGSYASDSNAAGLQASAQEIKMADAIVFPRPESPMVSVDPFVPLVTTVESRQGADEGAGTEEFSISDLKLKGIIILANQACALVENDNVIKKYAKGDSIYGYVIQAITTKGVQFENDGKEFFLANPVR